MNVVAVSLFDDPSMQVVAGRQISDFIIYALHHDDSDHIYIGKSSNGLRRPKQHGSPVNIRKHPNYPVVRWIKKRRASGEDYKIAILEEHATNTNLNEAERFYIASFRSIGVPLLNLTDGGDGLVNPSAEVRARIGLASHLRAGSLTAEAREKIGAASRGKPKSSEHRAKIAAANRGKTRSEECRRKMSIASTGKTHSLEARAKISEAGRLRPPLSAEARERVMAAVRGVPKSAEHRAKIAAANRLRPPPSAETRAKIGAVSRGKKLSPEHCAKIAAGLKKAWQKRIGEGRGGGGKRSPEQCAKIAAALKQYWQKRKAAVCEL